MVSTRGKSFSNRNNGLSRVNYSRNENEEIFTNFYIYSDAYRIFGGSCHV